MNMTSTTLLDVRYQRGDDPLLGAFRERRFELVWGTSTFVKRPDAPGDPNDSSQFLIPLIDQTQHYEIPPLRPGISGFEVAESAIDTVSYPIEEEDAETPAE